MSRKTLNRVTLIGYLGADPEIKYLPSGAALAFLSLATSEQWKDKRANEMREETTWHRVVLIGKSAEVAGQILKKGALVYVDGKNKVRKFVDKDTGKDRYFPEVRALEFKKLSGEEVESYEAADLSGQDDVSPYEGFDSELGF